MFSWVIFDSNYFHDKVTVKWTYRGIKLDKYNGN